MFPFATRFHRDRLFSDELTCGNYVGFTSLAPDLCFPVNNGAFSVAVRCDRSGTGNVARLLRLLFYTCLRFGCGADYYEIRFEDAFVLALRRRSEN